MSKLIILGSANAIPDEKHENTHLVLAGEKCQLLIDCVGNPLVRLRQAGLDIDDLTGMILTHFHPDHVSGVPSLLMSLWLLGRRKPLIIYGLGHTLDRVEKVMGLYEWEDWPNFFPVTFCRLPAEEISLVMENDEFRIFSSPVRHLLPTIGVRIESLHTGKIMAYSCDTEPCSQVIKLAEGVDVLIHEAAGPSPGHSSAAQAGETAQRAQAKSLYLIHYPTGDFASQSLVKDAQKKFPGNVELAEDFMELEF
ncbi:MAG: MBL fold metallo-hydrolase [Chloroflexi bacterium]|nr:MBL fold metallo-hydrolase [Chloroflexota bacterium]